MTDFINGITVKGIIENLHESSNLLNDAIDDEDCFAGTVGETNCFHCNVVKQINQIHSLINQFNRILPNTMHHVQFIDMFALKEALENYGNPIDAVELNPMWNNKIDNKFSIEHDDPKPDYYQFRISYSRYAMNGSGYHVGYETVIFTTNTINKRDLDIHGIPYLLSDQVINPDSFEIESKQLPLEEFPTIDSHDSKCEIFNPANRNQDEVTLLFDIKNSSYDPFPDDCNCGCNDMWEGYFHPEDDFFYEELDNLIHSILQSNDFPTGEFDNESKSWSIGNQVTWKVGNDYNSF